jgi:hypothetical protein
VQVDDQWDVAAPAGEQRAQLTLLRFDHVRVQVEPA